MSIYGRVRRAAQRAAAFATGTRAGALVVEAPPVHLPRAPGTPADVRQAGARVCVLAIGPRDRAPVTTADAPLREQASVVRCHRTERRLL